MPNHVATPGLHCVSFRKAVINSAASVILAVGAAIAAAVAPTIMAGDDGRPSHQTGQSHPMGERSIGERSWWKVSRRQIFHRFSRMRGGHRSGLASCFPFSRTALNHIK